MVNIILNTIYIYIGYHSRGLHPTKLEVICKTDVWRQNIYIILYILCINLLYFNIVHNLNHIKLLVL
jgi:hypothetical protein